MRMAGISGSAASSLASGSVMRSPCAAQFAGAKRRSQPVIFAPMGRGSASTGAVRVETNFRLMSGTIGQPPATARCKGTGAAHSFQFRRAY
jgi:hypothetical protein